MDQAGAGTLCRPGPGMGARQSCEDNVMDIRSIEQVPASPEHQGTVPVWWLFKPREMREETLGGHLELVSEFEVMGGGEVHPHSHPTFEFYYVISGRGIMTIAGEDAEIRQGDLVKIPPERRPQPQAGQPQRIDPLLRLRGGGARMPRRSTTRRNERRDLA